MSPLNNPNLGYVKNLYKNTRLKKIVNVYQKTYINIKCQGFGDFLRGSIYLTYICIILGLEFDIDLTNHPMSEYLSDKCSSYNFLSSNVEAFIDYYNNEQNEKIFIVDFIKKLNRHNEDTYYLFNNFKPLFHVENPEFNIIQKSRDIIIPKIEPIKFVLEQLDNKLDSVNLKRKEYAVIQIRAGDFFMNIKKNVDSEKHQISLKHVNTIISYINKYTCKTKKYILIGDSNKIKKHISSKFTNIISFDSQITHLGEDNNANSDAIIDTLIDFNIMRFSNFIVSFSAYGHGSGFSRYCATLYNVGFEQILLKPLLSYNV